jgi:hypothetical protein
MPVTETPERSALDVVPARRLSRMALVALLSALVGMVVLALAGLGSRWGWWEFRFGFRMLGWGVYLEAVAIVLGIAGAIVARPGARRRGFALALVALVLGAAGAGIMLRWRARAKAVPAIHDITTDVADPPSFVAVLPLRRGAANPAEYGGAEVAAQQQKGYPDIRPLVSSLPPTQLFPRALAAARGMGWTIDAAVPAEGRIEATARTFWFGFRDDVVVRIRPQGAGSRLDVRSVSRVGKSDVGTNARRIRKYLDAVRKELGGG